MTVQNFRPRVLSGGAERSEKRQEVFGRWVIPKESGRPKFGMNKVVDAAFRGLVAEPRFERHGVGNGATDLAQIVSSRAAADNQDALIPERSQRAANREMVCGLEFLLHGAFDNRDPCVGIHK